MAVSVSYAFQWTLVASFDEGDLANVFLSLRGRGACVMSLGSVLQTALTGMSAASAMVEVASNNIANWQTEGFEAQRVNLATQPPATVSAGGSNSVQVGTGVRIVGLQADSSKADLGQNLVDLTLASTQFRANANVFQTADSLLDELVYLGRRDG